MKRLLLCRITLLTMAAVFVGKAEGNVALGKPAAQNSSDPSNPASYAVDGDPGTCSNSLATAEADWEWFRVDLLYPHLIGDVTITTGASGDALGPFLLRVGYEDGSAIESNAICANVTSPLAGSSTETYNCGDISGRFVYIDAGVTNSQLIVCEMTVAATEVEITVAQGMYYNSMAGALEGPNTVTVGDRRGGIECALECLSRGDCWSFVNSVDGFCKVNLDQHATDVTLTAAVDTMSYDIFVPL